MEKKNMGIAPPILKKNQLGLLSHKRNGLVFAFYEFDSLATKRMHLTRIPLNGQAFDKNETVNCRLEYQI